MFIKWFLILFLLPQGVKEIPEKCKITKKCDSVHQFKIEKEFETKKECIKYLKNTFGIPEYKRRLFADYMRYGFFVCKKK